jgi:hypothetical protein
MMRGIGVPDKQGNNRQDDVLDYDDKKESES